MKNLVGFVLTTMGIVYYGKVCNRLGVLKGHFEAMSNVNKEMPGTIETVVVDVWNKDIRFKFNKEIKSTENQEEQESQDSCSFGFKEVDMYDYTNVIYDKKTGRVLVIEADGHYVIPASCDIAHFENTSS